MPREIISVDLTDSEAKFFIAALKAFMKDRCTPSYLGLTSLEFSLVLDDQYKIVVESNKAMNQGSRSQVIYLLQGFYAGWKAKS